MGPRCPICRRRIGAGDFGVVDEPPHAILCKKCGATIGPVAWFGGVFGAASLVTWIILVQLLEARALVALALGGLLTGGAAAATYWLTPWRVRHLGPRCDRCRYDLTGNTTGVCPECGTPISETSGLTGP